MIGRSVTVINIISFRVDDSSYFLSVRVSYYLLNDAQDVYMLPFSRSDELAVLVWYGRPIVAPFSLHVANTFI